MSFIRDFLFGKRGGVEQVSNLTGGQDDLLNFLIQNIQAGTGGFGADQDFFQRNYVDPAMQIFNSQIAPGIQQKFIAGGAGESSALNDSLARAGSDVQANLNQQLAGLVNSALDRQLQGANLALGTRSFQNVQRPGTTGFFGDLFGDLGQAAITGAAGPIGRGAGNLVRRGFR